MNLSQLNSLHIIEIDHANVVGQKMRMIASVGGIGGETGIRTEIVMAREAANVETGNVVEIEDGIERREMIERAEDQGVPEKEAEVIVRDVAVLVPDIGQGQGPSLQ
jgi:hypothetical protein